MLEKDFDDYINDNEYFNKKYKNIKYLKYVSNMTILDLCRDYVRLNIGTEKIIENITEL